MDNDIPVSLDYCYNYLFDIDDTMSDSCQTGDGNGNGGGNGDGNGNSG